DAHAPGLDPRASAAPRGGDRRIGRPGAGRAGQAAIHEQRVLRLPHRRADGNAHRPGPVARRCEVPARAHTAVAPRSGGAATARPHAGPRAERRAGDGAGRVPGLAPLRRGGCGVISIPVIRRHLTSDLLGRHIYLFGEGASEAVLRRLADAGAQEGTVVLAEDETHVHAAALFRPVLQPGAVETFGSITTLALAEAIEAVEGTG